MVEELFLRKNDNWEKEYFFEDLNYLSSRTSCGCTATKQIEVLPNGFKAIVSFKASSIGKYSHWVKFKVVNDKKEVYEIKLDLILNVE